METFNKNDVYLSDVEEDVYWSEEEDDVYFAYEDLYPVRPKCIGCSCSGKKCDTIMPLIGSVEILDLSFGPKMKDLTDYYWLLNVGVKIKFQCSRCNFCKECEKSLTKEETKNCSAFCQNPNNNHVTEKTSWPSRWSRWL